MRADKLVALSLSSLFLLGAHTQSIARVVTTASLDWSQLKIEVIPFRDESAAFSVIQKPTFLNTSVSSSIQGVQETNSQSISQNRNRGNWAAWDSASLLPTGQAHAAASTSTFSVEAVADTTVIKPQLFQLAKGEGSLQRSASVAFDITGLSVLVMTIPYSLSVETIPGGDAPRHDASFASVAVECLQCNITRSDRASLGEPEPLDSRNGVFTLRGVLLESGQLDITFSASAVSSAFIAPEPSLTLSLIGGLLSVLTIVGRRIRSH